MLLWTPFGDHPEKLYTRAPPSVVPPPAASTPPGGWLEIPFSCPTQTYWVRVSGLRAQESVLASSPGDSGATHVENFSCTQDLRATSGTHTAGQSETGKIRHGIGMRLPPRFGVSHGMGNWAQKASLQLPFPQWGTHPSSAVRRNTGWNCRQIDRIFYGKAHSVLGTRGPYFSHPHCTVSSLEKFYLWAISESKLSNDAGLAFLFVVLYCPFACVLTVDTENKSTFLSFHLGSPFAFELVDCLGTDATKYGLQMPGENLLTPREKKSCEIK